MFYEASAVFCLFLVVCVCVLSVVLWLTESIVCLDESLLENEFPPPPTGD